MVDSKDDEIIKQAMWITPEILARDLLNNAQEIYKQYFHPNGKFKQKNGLNYLYLENENSEYQTSDLTHLYLTFGHHLGQFDYPFNLIFPRFTGQLCQLDYS